MKYYQKLLAMGIFTFSDLVYLTGNKETASSLVQEYQKKQYIVRIKRNLYTVVRLDTNEVAVNKFEIGSNINETAYISHHSAFEYHRILNNVYYEVNVSSQRKFDKFKFQEHEYIYHQPKIREGVKCDKYNRKIRVTDLERTVLDSIKDFEKIGGLEELLRCLDRVTYLDHIKLERYLKHFNFQIMYQKAGYILEHFKESLKLPEKFFLMCQAEIGKSRRYLYREIRAERNIYCKKWQLVVPPDLLSVISTGVDQPV